MDRLMVDDSKRPDSEYPEMGWPVKVSDSKTFTQAFDTRFNSHLTRWVETRGIQPTSPDERGDPQFWKIFFIWMSANCNILSFSAGTVGPLVFDLGFRDAALVIMGFNMIGCLLPGYFSTFGPKIGMRQMVHTRYTWGFYLAAIPAVLNAATMMGFMILTCILGGEALATVSEGKLSLNVGIVIIAVLSLISLVQILGAAFAASASSVPAWKSGFADYSVAGLLHSILSPAGGFGSFLTVLLALSLTGNMAPTLYSWSLNLQVVFPMFNRLPRPVFSLVAVSILIPLSVVGKTRFYGNLVNFLGIIGYWVGCFGATILVEHWLVRRGRWSEYDAMSWDRAYELPLGCAALVASGGSFGLTWASESTVTARKIRSLGLSVFNPDDSSDEDGVPHQPRRSVPQSNPIPKPLPVPGQPVFFQHQLTQQPVYQQQSQRQLNQNPIHSASSSQSSISILTSSSVPAFQYLNGRPGPSQSSPTSRYANNSPHNYVSSSSSRSSPAMDTTPPPTTPSNNLPPISIATGVIDDRNLDALGLTVADENDVPTYNQTRPDPRNGSSPYVDHTKSASHSHLAVHTNSAPSPASYERRESVDRVIITATADAENHVIVDITGAKDAAFIRERIFSKLRIPDEEHDHYSIYRTELGEAALGDPVSDDQLMIYCEAWADGKGTLKFLVQRNSPTPTSYFPPSNHIASPPVPVSSTPPLYSPAYGRSSGRIGGEGSGSGGVSSADRDRDRPPWDRLSNGYDGDVDVNHNVGRHQSPTPIDTRRKREPSASSSESYGLSPSSPQGPGLPQPIAMSPIITTRRPQPQLAQPSAVSSTPAFLVPQNPTPSSSRRRDAEQAAQEREQALEASERLRESQAREYDAQFRRKQLERERQSRRQQQMHGAEGSVGSTRQSHRSESVDASGVPHGWVVVEPVYPHTPSTGGAESSGRYATGPPRSSSFSRSTPGAGGDWNPHIGSPPSDTSRFPPPSSAASPATNRPYPHATSLPYTASTPTTRTGPTTPLQRAHPPLPSTGKYPNPHPHPRDHTRLPAGAADPRMRQMQAVAPPPSQFYPTAIPGNYNVPPSSYNPPQNSRLQPNGRPTPTENTLPKLGSPRSIPDLRQYVPASPGMRTATNLTSASSVNAQMPIGPSSTSRKPSALPPTNIMNENIYNRTPQSPNRLPPPSPSRPILSPSSYYTSPSSGGTRSPATPSDFVNNSAPRSISSTSLFNSGIFADSPIGVDRSRLRSKPSYDRLNALDRTMAAQSREQSLNPQRLGLVASRPAPSTGELTDEGSEGTLKPGDRMNLMSLMGSDNDADVEGTGTMRPRSIQPPTTQQAAVTAKATRMSLRRARAKSILTKDLNQAFGDQEEEFDDEEEYSDDEDDDRFWNLSSAAAPSPTPAIKTTKPDDEPSGPSVIPSRTASGRTRGPSLSLHIEPVDDRQQSPTPTPAASSASTNQSLTPQVNSPSSQTPTSAVNRRASFRVDTWAFRPSAEDVYDRLQDFFPNHDLDKTFIEPAPAISSGSGSPTTEIPPPMAISPPPSNPNKFKHRKSIRYVAEERKKALDRINAGKEPTSKAAAVARKRSTKLWGSKVEEVTPGQARSTIPPIPESPTGPGAVKPTIKWVKGELIGKGTYGKVFLALNASTGEMLAVKQVEMPQTISDHDDVKQVSIVNALKAERETLENLDHPNIVQYLGFEQTKEFFSIFLEYVPGGSVGSCLRKHGKFEEEIIKSFTGQILEGLAYLHGNKIIHRDVKADNILVDPIGTCKISDFGISKRSDDIYNNAAMTAMQGSLFWMAPEMLHNNKKGYNAKIDIWSLGCVFIEMFAGRRPWEQDDFVSVMFKVGHNKMAPPVPEDVTLSEEADDFRLRCFTQDPEERPTAEALKSHSWLVLKPGWYFTGFH
ncbi:hypothetical protein FRB99_000934 [Tulasnella sp. 403]|nr:hypothetical protein FRB99_000934 [Tulasnella sp. 403]